MFALSGVLTALAGGLLSYSLAAASPVALVDALVPATAAAIIGGVSLSGGRGTPIGIAGGVLVLGVLRSGLTAIGVPPFVHDIVTGGVLLAVALLDAPELQRRLLALRRAAELERMHLTHAPRIDIHTHVAFPEILGMARAIKLRGNGPGKRDWVPAESKREHVRQAGRRRGQADRSACAARRHGCHGGRHPGGQHEPADPVLLGECARSGARIARDLQRADGALRRRHAGALSSASASFRCRMRRPRHESSITWCARSGCAACRSRRTCATATSEKPRSGRSGPRRRRSALPVIVHPRGFTHDDRLHKFFFWNTIGQPLEEALAMASLIHEGILDAYPARSRS